LNDSKISPLVKPTIIRFIHLHGAGIVAVYRRTIKPTQCLKAESRSCQDTMSSPWSHTRVNRYAILLVLTLTICNSACFAFQHPFARSALIPRSAIIVYSSRYNPEDDDVRFSSRASSSSGGSSNTNSFRDSRNVPGVDRMYDEPPIVPEGGLGSPCVIKVRIFLSRFKVLFLVNPVNNK